MSLILCYSAAVNAQNAPNAIAFEMKDGSSVAFFYNEQPTLRFTATEIVVKTNEHETSYPQSAVQRYVFAYRSTSSIDTPSANGVQVKFTTDNILVDNLKPGTEVTLISIDGKVLAVDAADANGNCAIDLSSFPAGIYLLSYSNVSVKIAKT